LGLRSAARRSAAIAPISASSTAPTMPGVGRSTARPAIRASRFRIRTTELGYGRGQPGTPSIHRERALGLRVEELGDELVVGVEQLVRRARLDDPALPQDGDEVRDAARRAEVVADHQVAAAVLLVDLADQLAEQGRS